MDKLNKLKALTGEDEVLEGATPKGTWSHVKAHNIYEGTDSEDEDEEIPLARRTEPESSNSNDKVSITSRDRVNDFKEYQLKQGDLAADGENFVPWQAIKKYPYMYIGKANGELVSKNFFDKGKVCDNIWDFFYIHRAPKDPNQSPILVIPTKQFEAFLGTINRELNLQLSIPSGASNSGGFRVSFSNDGTPRPRYLGRATNKDMVDGLHNDIPPKNFKPHGEISVVESPSEVSLLAFKAKCDLMMRAQRGKKAAADKEKRKAKRQLEQQVWGHSIKRVQRYLGLRQASVRNQMDAISSELQKLDLQWQEHDTAVQKAMAELLLPDGIDTGKPAPHSQDGSVVFISVDVEAYERNKRLITEIGISTLDTKDIASLSPGNGGVNWRKMIRARHFRIEEYKHLENFEFVDGCADKFEFGDSEFISLKDAPHVVSTCFKHPFSKPNMDPSTEDGPKRTIILVGHDLDADINFLQTIGYNLHNLSTLTEAVDTSSMWRYLKQEANPRNLASILAELDIVAWNLHNAGNDAAYTLQAMLAIAIKDLVDKQKQKEAKDQEEHATVNESVKELTAITDDNDADSTGNGSDGGVLIEF